MYKKIITNNAIHEFILKTSNDLKSQDEWVDLRQSYSFTRKIIFANEEPDDVTVYVEGDVEEAESELVSKYNFVEVNFIKFAEQGTLKAYCPWTGKSANIRFIV